MSRRIVSWWINEPRVSPALSSASAVVRDITADTIGVQLAELTALVHGSANPTSEESFVQHDIYFFKDGNITFLVRDSLYCSPGSLKRGVGRRHPLLRPSVLLLSGLSLLLYQTGPTRRP
jgi:hypothetical protein